jgi:hypothetical protein
LEVKDYYIFDSSSTAKILSIDYRDVSNKYEDKLQTYYGTF